MKKCCTGLAVILVSLVAFGVVNAQQDFHGVIDPFGHAVTVDTAIVTVTSVAETIATPGWGVGSSPDTFDFPDLTEWPDSVVLMGTINASAVRSVFPDPVRNTWYVFGPGGMTAARAMFYGATGVEEPRSTVEPRPCLNVSPSVVAAQMTVRLERPGSGRPVVEVFDAAGNLIRSLDCTAGADGFATATWHRDDGLGHLVPGGVYFCRYAASGAVAVRKVLVAH
jgi:hypothetical protein